MTSILDKFWFNNDKWNNILLDFCLKVAFLITTSCLVCACVWLWSWKWYIAPHMSDSLVSAAHALRLCSGMRGCLMGAVFCFWGERGLPRDPPLFIYFILSPACWVKRELRLRELRLGDEGLFNHTHMHMNTHTLAYTGSPVCSSETGNTPDSIRAHSIRAQL